MNFLNPLLNRRIYLGMLLLVARTTFMLPGKTDNCELNVNTIGLEPILTSLTKCIFFQNFKPEHFQVYDVETSCGEYRSRTDDL